MIRVTVIVPARDAEATLPRALAALADQEGAPSFEVVVADDGSRDGTAAIVERAGARLVRLEGRGPAAARNAAAAVAGGSLLAFCDADVFPAPGWLAAGSRALAGADVVQGSVLPDPRAPRSAFDRSRHVTRESGLYDPASLFVRRELLERAGGFRDGPGEDARFGRRARDAGARTAFCEEAVVHHAVVARDAVEYVGERSRLRELPALAAELPELRGTLMHRRLFLSSRTMKLDLALAGLVVAALRRSALPLLAVAPYALELRRHARERAGDGDWRPVAAVDAAADIAGAAALARGSLAARTPVL